jgi:hypothetical protein
MKKNGASERGRLSQKHARGDVGAIRIPDRDNRGRRESIFSRGLLHKLSKLVGSLCQIFLIENAFGEATKKPWHSALENLSARREE